jgi:lipoprotein-anchoring transpeptidase ErfK/SrfK
MTKPSLRRVPVAPAVADTSRDGRARLGAHPRSSQPLVPKRGARHAFLLAAVALVALGAGAAAFFLALTSAWHASTAQPGVQLGAVDVSGFDEARLAETVTALAAGARVAFSYEGLTVEATLADLGVTPDTDTTVQAALRAEPGIVAGKTEWAKETVPIAFTVDEAQIQDWLAGHVTVGATRPVNAAARFDAATDRFVVSPARDGWVFDLAPLDAALAVLALHPDTIPDCPLTLVKTGPAIGDAAALAAADAANDRLDLTMRFTVGDDAYTATPADIAGWIRLTPDPAAGRIGLDYDAAAVAATLAARLGDLVATSGTPARQVAGPDGTVLAVVDEGTPEVMLGDLADVAATVAQTLAQGTQVDLAVPVTTRDAGTITTTVAANPPARGQWIDVDLTAQVTTLFEDGAVVASFVISSGKAETPTPAGDYSVYAKVALQDMSGYNADGTTYSIADVPWATWFWGNYGFHAAYWLDESQIGTPQSHGCINMRVDEAKFLYDWADIGTTVTVHGTAPDVAD